MKLLKKYVNNNNLAICHLLFMHIHNYPAIQTISHVQLFSEAVNGKIDHRLAIQNLNREFHILKITAIGR